MSSDNESVRLEMTPSWVNVHDASPLVLRIIGEATSAKDPRAYFSPAYRKGYTDGYYHLFDSTINRFPTGLLLDVMAKLEEKGVDFSSDFFSSIPQYFQDTKRKVMVPPGIVLRDYQEEALEVSMQKGRGIIHLPVNGGKSLIAVVLANSFPSDWPILVLASRIEGVKQLYDLFVTHFGEDEVSTDVDQSARIVVMTYSTASRRDLSTFYLVISDEIHRCSADSYNKAVMGCDLAYHRFGLSGTPGGREDGKDIYFFGATGPIIYSIPQQLLVDRGYSAQAKIIFLEIFGSSGTSSKDWHVIEEKGIVENEQRNDTIVEVAKEACKLGKPTLILVHRIAHGSLLSKRLSEECGVEVPFTHGQLTSAERDKLYTDFKGLKHSVLVASGIYDDSIDIPHIEVLVVAGGGKSLIATKQKLGRGLRNPGGKELILVDFDDNHSRILKRHSKARMKNYAAEGFPVSIAQGAKDVFGSEGRGK